MGSLWLTCPQARPDAVTRLICLPHAGGGTAAFFPLARLLPAAIELRGVRLPGRESRIAEPPYTAMRLLVPALVDGVREIVARPYALFGHSLGALVAFELARELRRRELPLPHTIVVSGRRAPTAISAEAAIHKLPDDAFIAELIRRYDAIPEAVLKEPELMALFVPVLKADFALFETHTHRPEPPLDCRLAIYGGEDDPQTPEMAGWADLFAGTVRRRLFPGGHFYMAGRPGQPGALAAALAEDVLAGYAGAKAS